MTYHRILQKHRDTAVWWLFDSLHHCHLPLSTDLLFQEKPFLFPCLSLFLCPEWKITKKKTGRIELDRVLLYGKLSFTIFLANLVPAWISSLILKTKIFYSNLNWKLATTESARLPFRTSTQENTGWGDKLSPRRSCIAPHDKGFRQSLISFCWLCKPLISQSKFKLSRPVHVRYREALTFPFIAAFRDSIGGSSNSFVSLL